MMSEIPPRMLQKKEGGEVRVKQAWQDGDSC